GNDVVHFAETFPIRQLHTPSPPSTGKREQESPAREGEVAHRPRPPATLALSTRAAGKCAGELIQRSDHHQRRFLALREDVLQVLLRRHQRRLRLLLRFAQRGQLGGDFIGGGG